MYKLSDIRQLIKDKLAEGSDEFFTTDIINKEINTTLAEIATETLCYYVVSKTLVEKETDGIICPPDFIDIIEFAVNNQMYTRISFGELAEYIGDDAVFPNDFVYYVRNHKLITLSGLKERDELTLYYNAHFPKLVDGYNEKNEPTDELPMEFNNLSFIQVVVYGTCWRLKERDEDYKAASYFRDIYMYKLQYIKKNVIRRKRGHMYWKLGKANMNSPRILSGGHIWNRANNING